jgi:energy-converting hydrogenase Eha subunit G
MVVYFAIEMRIFKTTPFFFIIHPVVYSASSKTDAFRNAYLTLSVFFSQYTLSNLSWDFCSQT